MKETCESHGVVNDVLGLWKDIMNLLVEVLDPFNKYGCMISLGLSIYINIYINYIPIYILSIYIDIY
jgi:hypothetical protein